MAERTPDRRPQAAIVTGASSGLGHALTRLLFAKGWSVLGLAPDLAPAEAEGENGNVRWNRPVDLADTPAGSGEVDAFAAAAGRLDVLVNNAAVQRLGTAEELGDEDWHESLAVNLTAPFRLARAAIPHMRRAGGGVILNVTSVHAAATGPRRTAYAATKAGLVGLTRALAVDYGRDNIRAIALSPGPFGTEKLREGIANLYPDMDPEEAIRRYARTVPLGRVGTVEEFAEFATRLVDEPASFLTGTEITFDGGLTTRLAVGD